MRVCVRACVCMCASQNPTELLIHKYIHTYAYVPFFHTCLCFKQYSSDGTWWAGLADIFLELEHLGQLSGHDDSIGIYCDIGTSSLSDFVNTN